MKPASKSGCFARMPDACVAARMGATAHWDRLAVYYTTDSLLGEQRRLTASALAQGSLEQWQETHGRDIERFDAFVADLKTADALTLPRLIIAAKKIEEVGRK